MPDAYHHPTCPISPCITHPRRYDPDIILDWYRNMWLSNPDFCQIFDRSIAVELPAAYDGHAIVNGTLAWKPDNVSYMWWEGHVVC